MAITEAPTAGPPRWAADPEGRFDVRWFDGVSWTQHVAIQGLQGSSPPGLPAEQAAMVVTQLIDLLPAPRPPLPSTWGPVPPPPTHVPPDAAPATLGWQPDLANARPLTPEERAAAIQSSIRQRGSDRARDRCPMHWRLLARLIDNTIWGTALLATVMIASAATPDATAAIAGARSLDALRAAMDSALTPMLVAAVPTVLVTLWATYCATDGQTPGQRLLAIHAVDVFTGRRVGWFRFVVFRVLMVWVLATVVAYAVLLLPVALDVRVAILGGGAVLSLLTPWVSRRNQTVPDMVAGIMLVRPGRGR